jgi:hypothetical protein
MAVISNIPIVIADGTLTILDGTATPLSFAVPFVQGNLKIGGLNLAQQDSLDFFDRQTFIGTRNVKAKLFSITFTCLPTATLGVAGAPSILDVMRRKVDWLAATSTLPTANGDTFHHTLRWNIERTNLGATGDNIILAKYCEITDFEISEGDGAVLSITAVGKPFSTDFLTFT